MNVEERLEDFQHDLAVIGQIAGLVASLRQSYDVSKFQSLFLFLEYFFVSKG